MNIQDMDLDYIKLYCMHYSNGRIVTTDFKKQLTMLAEAGCEKAIKFWYVLFAQEPNNIIDKYISGEETCSADLLVAKANKEQYSNPNKYRFTMPMFNMGDYTKNVRWPIMRLLDLAYKKYEKELKDQAIENHMLEQEMVNLKIAFCVNAGERPSVNVEQIRQLRRDFERDLTTSYDVTTAFYLVRNLQTLAGFRDLTTDDFDKLNKLMRDIAERPFVSDILKQFNFIAN